MNAWPFNPQQAKHSWVTIEADGFDDPVPGCIYDGPRLDGGVPLGGLGTGYFTLEGSGKTGFCSIYNDIVPPRRADKDWLTVHVGDRSLPLSSADIAYWGHFPVADLVAEFGEVPVSLGVRAFSPFIVGDAADSNIPAALFEIEITNRGDEPLAVELAVTPPAPPHHGQGPGRALGRRRAPWRRARNGQPRGGAGPRRVGEATLRLRLVRAQLARQRQRSARPPVRPALR